MKTISTYLSAVVLLLTMALLSGCEGEKDLIIIDELLPIKTSTLFMVGDATPAGWNINEPTPLAVTEEDPMTFVYEGELNKGEFKLCIQAGNWGNPFIRPAVDKTEITKLGLAEATFVMYAGDPDNKWSVAEAAIYRLTFNLRNWTMKADYVADIPEAPKTPIETETLFILGDATPYGWSLASCVSLTQDAENKYRFSTTVDLAVGEMKACLLNEDNNWGQPFIHPTVADCAISKSGVANPDFNFYAGDPDNKWKVTEAGKYTLVFDLQNYTLQVTVAE